MDVLFLSQTCRGCRMVLQAIKGSPHLLKHFDVKFLDNNPQAHLDLATLGARAVPTLVILGPRGEKLGSFTGAGQVVAEMMRRYAPTAPAAQAQAPMGQQFGVRRSLR